MKSLLFLFFLICCCVPVRAQGFHESTGLLTLDGKLDDAYWRAVPAQILVPAAKGVPAELGGEIRFGLRGAYFCLAARLPEPGGKVLAHSMGRNPVWEKDALESPDVEDKVVYALRYRSADGAQRDLTIAINPWGAYRVEDAGRVVPAAEILGAAEVNPQGWTIEVAIPPTLFDLNWAADSRVEIRAERIRSRRALAPEYRWAWPGAGVFAPLALPARTTETAAVAAPALRPPGLGNTDPPLEVGRVLQVPPALARWDDPAWSNVPEFTLARNEPSSRAPRHATRVKWMHDGRNLALHFRVEEPEHVVARAGGRDSAVTADDHVAIYLATSGSAFLQIAVNSVGAIRDAVGRGPRSTVLNYAWNGAIEVQTDIRRGHWIARINIPLDQCAAALGETAIPSRWRILLARHRAARSGEVAESSTLPVLDGASSFYGPIRYQAMVLSSDSPSEVKLPQPTHGLRPFTGLAGEIAGLDSNVWSPLEHRYRGVRTMLQRYLQRRVEEAVLAERRAWEQVKTREDWERFRDERIRGLRESLGRFPPEAPPLDVRITARHRGEGYLLENLVFQSRPGFYLTANLYLPDRSAPPVPGIIIVHSQHAPKTQWELHDSGEIWARAGCAVLIIERPGYGERAETNTWYRQAYASRFTFTKQLFLVGESYSAWATWDVIRSVDFLFARPEVDRKRIILIGAVAGGAEPAAVAAALDPRIVAVVPYNYDAGHVRVHGDSPGQIAKQFSPWLVAASVAPRKFVRAFEFAWEGAEEPDLGSLWVDTMSRSEQVWGFYGAQESLAGAQGFGLIQVANERRSPCHSIGPEHREGLYPLLERWFGIPWPSAKDRAILPSSQLSSNVDREASRRQEAQRLRPHSDLLSIPAEVSAQLSRKKMHQIALVMGQQQLQYARAHRQSLGAKERAQSLRDDFRPVLGDIDPAASPKAETLWKRPLSAGQVEAISLEIEDGIRVPLLLLLPAAGQPHGAVVAVAYGGKDRFIAGRANDLETLLRAGFAVCLPDVRGTGETASGEAEDSDTGLAQREFDLSRNLLGSRLKDLRTVLAYLRRRPDIDGKRIAVWGESFTPANSQNLFLDELEYEAGPQVQRMADPLGAHLALLTGLYEDSVRVVAARGGLAGYLSVLEDAFTYTPMDVIGWGILKAGDIADIASALVPRPVMLSNLVGGRNIRVPPAELKKTFEPAQRAYQQARAADQFSVGAEPGDLVAWLNEKLK
jgi:cephalosporin-C deacetylase-like acetyl esterase